MYIQVEICWCIKIPGLRESKHNTKLTCEGEMLRTKMKAVVGGDSN